MPENNLPTSGLSDWQLKLSYFYVSNKLLLRKILIVCLIALNCWLWGYSIYGLAIWALDYNRLKVQTQNLLFSSSDTLPILEALKPQPLALSDIESFAGTGDRYDLVAQAVNPNGNWSAQFEYAFIDDKASTTYFSAFALPGQKKILMDLGRASSNVRLEIRNLTWQKVTDYSELKFYRERFTVEDDQFFPATKIGDPSRLKFTLKNESPFGYWEAGIAIFLYSGGQAAGVNYLSIPQLKSGLSREVEINWLKPLPTIDSLEIIPEIDYLNEKNLMPPSAF